MKSPQSPSFGENRPLTSLRGFAAIWVVFSHVTVAFADQWSGLSWDMLRAGYMGVDVFFVLSGFILGLVYQNLSLPETPRFFLKRALRVYPLNIAVLLVLVILSRTVMPMGDWGDLHKLPLFVLMLEGYASEPVGAWNPVTWSVGIELACYACFPLVIVWLRRLPTLIVALCAAVLLVVSWWCQGFVHGWPYGWHALVRGMSGFWPGVFLATFALRLPRLPSLWVSAGEVLCVAALLASVAYEEIRLVPPLTGGLVFFLFFNTGIVGKWMRASWCFWLGEISFSIYLIFGLLLPQLLVHLQWLVHMLPPPVSVYAFIAIYLLITMGLAQVTYTTIERPFRRLGRVRTTAHDLPFTFGVS